MPKYTIINSTSSAVVLPPPLSGNVAPHSNVDIVASADEVDTPEMRQLIRGGAIRVSTVPDRTLNANAASVSRQEELDRAYTFFWHWLHFDSPDGWTPAEIYAGLSQTVLTDEGDLPALPPDPFNVAFTIIDDGLDSALKLAYWDGGGLAGTWMVTTAPWSFPFLAAGPVINLNPANGTGNNAWNFSMGSEHRVLNPGNITEMYIKQAQTPVLGHRWEIRRSTVTGATAPPINTYTTILDTGVHFLAAANTWEAVGITGPIAVVPNEWIISYHFVSGAGGQFANSTTLRGAGELVEDYAFLNGGIYALTGGPAPGTNPLPVPATRAVGTIYGVNTLEFGP